MTPPEAPQDGTASPGDRPPAVSVCLRVLKTRADFLRLSRARRQATGTMIVQARRRPEGAPPGRDIRVGYTCSKKVGNAVARNRAKRRLRAAAREILPAKGRAGWDYVLIGRRDVTGSAPFETLLRDLGRALEKLHGPGR